MTLVGILMVGGGHVFVCVCVSWEYRNSMYFPLNFSMNLKLLQKLKCTEKNFRENDAQMMVCGYNSLSFQF